MFFFLSNYFRKEEQIHTLRHFCENIEFHSTCVTLNRIKNNSCDKFNRQSMVNIDKETLDIKKFIERAMRHPQEDMDAYFDLF